MSPSWRNGAKLRRVIVGTLRAFLTGNDLMEKRVVVAISGGVDSTALLLAFHELGGMVLTAAHVNHHLRGQESDGDELFVRDLCAMLGIALHVLDGALPPELIKADGIEGAARTVRYANLQALRNRVSADLIATAHQRDDQAETILMRLLMGSGVGGLRGIHPVRADGIIRPLLDVPRAALEGYVQARGISARHDTSNDDPRFLRNRVRSALRVLGPDSAERLALIAERASEQWELLERLTNDADASEVTDSETRFRRWPDEQWLRQSLLQRHIRRLDPSARDVSEADLRRLAESIEKLTRVTVTASLELLRRGDNVVLRRLAPGASAFELPLQPGRPIRIPQAAVRLEIARSAWQPGESFDAGRRRQKFALPAGAEPHFTVRNRRPGDRFQPLGFTHEKKLKDVLIDRKIERERRDRIPLLVWHGSIVWIPGVEVSERFRLRFPAAGVPAADVYEVCIEDDREDDPR
jgi:tRNA(Ile)-lysidine synthase